MARYKLTRPSYLNDRYYAEGSFVDWEGTPNKAMVPVDEKGKALPVDAADKAAEKHVASEVPMPGGEVPDPTWAPQTRPAFSVKTSRKPDPNDPDKQATVVRVAASAPSASSEPPDKDRPLTSAETRAVPDRDLTRPTHSVSTTKADDKPSTRK